MSDYIASVDMHEALSVCHGLGNIARLIDYDGLNPAEAVYETVSLYSKTDPAAADLIALVFAQLTVIR